mmetsp:Transcript_22667/g.56133  ORF Transcript_22667/g.56133 Transcript_22667/m.56133 type:complete len:119 (-) Transcript_22667:18-374(-)
MRPFIIKSDKRSPGTLALRSVKTSSWLQRVQLSFVSGMTMSDKTLDSLVSGISLLTTKRATTHTTVETSRGSDNAMNNLVPCRNQILPTAAEQNCKSDAVWRRVLEAKESLVKNSDCG